MCQEQTSGPQLDGMISANATPSEHVRFQSQRAWSNNRKEMQMDRRIILTGAAATAAGLALPWGAAHAQQAGNIYRIGVLVNRSSPGPETDTLRAGLTQLGYTEGINVVYEVRPAEGQLDRLPGFAAELVSKGVDVIVTYGGPP